MCHIVKVVKRSQRSLADQVALAFANKQPFDILANDGTTINMPANTAAAQMKAAYPYPGRRDRLSHYAPRCRDIVYGYRPRDIRAQRLWVDPRYNERLCREPCDFPGLGSPNPMLTGIASIWANRMRVCSSTGP